MTKYNNIRNELLRKLHTLHDYDFHDLSSAARFKELMNSTKIKTMDKFIIDC